jgi:hypothetical protein
MVGTYDDYGVRFRYPEGWEVEVTDEGPVTTVALHSANGPAFTLVTLDDSLPDPETVADQALEVMREEYPELDAFPASETIGGHAAVGHDVEFFALDVTNTCAIRCFRTDRRTVLLFGQWSDLEGDEATDVLVSVRRSFEETDAAEDR